MKEEAPNCGFYDYASETSFHGLGYIRRDKPCFSQCFWLLAFLGGGVLTGFFIYDGLMTFMNQPTATSYNFVVEEKLQYPTVILCTLNRLKKTKMDEMGISEELQKVLHGGFHSIPVASLPEEKEELGKEAMKRTKEEYQQLMLRLGLKDFAELIDRLTDECSDLVETCLDVSKRKRYDCCQGSRKLIYGTGVCFAIPTTVQFKALEGFQIFARLPENKDKTKQLFGNYPNNALLFSLTSQQNVSAVKGATRFAAAGTHTQVLLTTKKISIEKNQHADNYKNQLCTDDYSSESYSKEDCLMNCWTKVFREKCRCQRMDVVTGLEDSVLPTCTPWDVADCQIEPDFDQLLACSKTCLPACEQIAYDTDISTAPFDSMMMSYWREDTVEVPLMLRSRALLEIMFRDMQTVHVRQYWAATLSAVIGQIGGQVGLWIGGSILTLVHILVYICECGCRGQDRIDRYEKPQRKNSVGSGMSSTGNTVPPYPNQSSSPQNWSGTTGTAENRGSAGYPMSHYPPSMTATR